MVLIVMLLMLSCSIYIVHDEVKDKAFELDLSWAGEGKDWWIGSLPLTCEQEWPWSDEAENGFA